MKRILAMALSIAIIATIVVGGTVAYLTDDEESVNVMTVGKVDIELIEQQRSEDGSKLEDFVDGKNLLPLVGSAQANSDDTNMDKWGMVTAENYIDKIVRVKNIGKNPAWLRVFYGVPTALEGNADDAGDDVLHTNMGNRFDSTGEGRFNTGAWNVAGNDYFDDFGAYKTSNPVFVGKEEIDDIEYNVWCYTMLNELEVGETSAAVLVGAYLDTNVDYNDEDGYYYLGDKNDRSKRITVNGLGGSGEAFDFDSGVYIPVFAQAVQSGGFEGAEDAFGTVFDDKFETENDGKMYNPWAGRSISLGTVVEASTVAELKKAFKTRGKVVVKLTDDIEIEDRLYVEQDCDVTLDMNGKTISTTNEDIFMITTWSRSKLTITGNGTFLTDTDEGAILLPGGEVIIRNGNFLRTACTNKNVSLFAGYIGDKNPSVKIYGGYFDGGYTGTDCEGKCLSLINIAQNGGPVTIYGGTFVGQNPAWGDQGHATACPHCEGQEQWCHGTFLVGQKITDETIPAEYSITEETLSDGRIAYTVNYDA